jgi:hypothetical protein
MPAQTTQATLAGISVRLQNVEETLREILARVAGGSPPAGRQATPPPK